MRRLVGFFAAALLVGACGSSSGSDQGARVPTSSAAGSSSATQVAAALAFTLPGVTGAQVRGADYAGKSLALWFWAPW